MMRSKFSLRLVSSELFSVGRRYRSRLGNLIYLGKSSKIGENNTRHFAIIVRNASSSVIRHREKRVWREIWRALDKTLTPNGFYVWITSENPSSFQEKTAELQKILEKIK